MQNDSDYHLIAYVVELFLALVSMREKATLRIYKCPIWTDLTLTQKCIITSETLSTCSSIPLSIMFWLKLIVMIKNDSLMILWASAGGVMRHNLPKKERNHDAICHRDVLLLLSKFGGGVVQLGRSNWFTIIYRHILSTRQWTNKRTQRAQCEWK